MNSNQDTELLPVDDQQTSEWLAVLSAAGLDYSLSYAGGQWTLHVPASLAARAHAEIDAYEEDARTWPKIGPDAPLPATTQRGGYGPPWVTGVVLVAYAWLGAYRGEDALLRAAAVDAGAVLRGEWWRVVTGLTLHSGIPHLAGNVLCLLALEYGLSRVFGRGITWLLLLATGALGNAAACMLYGPGHLSVGASTACFGGLGIASAYQALRNLRRHGLEGGIWSRTWLPLGAGLALLTLLGTGERSDLAAHALGFAVGLLLAVPLGLIESKRIPAWVQRAIQLACAAMVAAAWAAAWRGQR